MDEVFYWRQVSNVEVKCRRTYINKSFMARVLDFVKLIVIKEIIKFYICRTNDFFDIQMVGWTWYYEIFKGTLTFYNQIDWIINGIFLYI